MFERRDLGAGWVHSLLWLLELSRIAEKHEATTGPRNRKRVGQCHLASFVDHERIHAARKVVARPGPGGAAQHIDDAAFQLGPRLLLVAVDAKGPGLVASVV